MTWQNIRFLIEQNRQMTGHRFAVAVRDQRGKAVGVNKRVDRLPIFYAIERRIYMKKEVTSDQ
jgi:hypothetical protein